MSYFAISLDNFNFQGVIMNDEGDAVEFSPRNSRKVWSSEKKEVAGSLEIMLMLIAMKIIRLIELVWVPAEKNLLTVPPICTKLCINSVPMYVVFVSQVKEVRKTSIMEKTKKNIALEASLFRSKF